MCLLWEQNIKLNFDRPHITILIRCIRMCPWRSHWQSHTIGNLLTTCVALVHSNSLVCQIPFTVLDFEVHWICQSICNLHCVHIDVVALNRNLISLSIFIQFTWCRPVFISECIESMKYASIQSTIFHWKIHWQYTQWLGVTLQNWTVWIGC